MNNAINTNDRDDHSLVQTQTYRQPPTAVSQRKMGPIYSLQAISAPIPKNTHTMTVKSTLQSVRLRVVGGGEPPVQRKRQRENRMTRHEAVTTNDIAKRHVVIWTYLPQTQANTVDCQAIMSKHNFLHLPTQ